VALLALVLALLVLAPNVSPSGSWAHPASLIGLGTTSEHDAIEPAQLVPPAALPRPELPQTLVLLAVITCLALQWPPQEAARRGMREPLRIPGRRGRAVLQAFLN
jgi:hypothetical protein